MNSVTNLGIRYLILILLGLFNLKLIYFIFTPLTIYPVFWILSLFDTGTTLLPGSIIFSQGFYFEIINACVAGAAYYLLLILNLSTPMDWKKRIKSLVFILSVFLILNVARIIIFAWLFVLGYQYFDTTHLLVWYLGSTILLIAVWFINVWMLEIKSIPVYTDVRKIIDEID